MSNSGKTSRVSSMALAAAIMLAALFGAAVRAEAQAAQNKIAFDRDGEIWTMNADGSGQARIGQFLQGVNPSWSPDGNRLAFQCGIEYTDICVMDADGNNLLALTNTQDNSNPAWSPDGSRIAFTSMRETGIHIFVMKADGTDVQRLAVNDSSITGEDYAAWSPDGARIAFVGNYYDPSTESGGDYIYTMRADGTDAPVRVSPAGDPHIKAGTAWSPDGTKIAYTKFYQTGTLHVVGADGTPSGIAPLTDGEDNSTPAWSTDSKQIVFNRRYIFRDENGSVIGNQNGLYVLNVETGGVSSLNAQDAHSPAFRPVVKQPDPDPTPAPTPAERVAALIEKVKGFGLPFGTTNSLTVKLRQALDALNAGNTEGACTRLASFISEATAQSGKKIPAVQAGQVITEAASIRTALGCQ